MTETHDKDGRPYARLSELRPGSLVQVDEDFDCMEPWSIKTVEQDSMRLFISCSSDGHDLEGQLQDDNDTLIGIYHYGD